MGWQGSDRNAASTSEMGRFETETLTQEDNLKGLALMNPQWVKCAMTHTPHRRVILDMDSSESPVHGQRQSLLDSLWLNRQGSKAEERFYELIP